MLSMKVRKVLLHVVRSTEDCASFHGKQDAETRLLPCLHVDKVNTTAQFWNQDALLRLASFLGHLRRLISMKQHRT